MNTQVLFDEMLESFTVLEVANKLNLAKGTILRWIENKKVPDRYIFDFCRHLNKPIDYSSYSQEIKDQFFTPLDMAEECLRVTKSIIDTNDFTFIEPSAGDGSFLKVLPEKSIGLDIEPRANDIQKCDYLNWEPDDKEKKYIVFGNPPFGLRGHLALQFINHSYEFADYVCFILPQLFDSDGKGCPMKRVKYNLIHSNKISGMFHMPDGNEMNINGVFQIWSKHTKNPKYQLTNIHSEYVKIYSLSDGGTPSSTRNKKMLHKCDAYIPSTCFGKETMTFYKSFDELPNRKGYGLVFMKDKDKLLKYTQETIWGDVAFLSTNSAYNIRTSIIYNHFSKIVCRKTVNAEKGSVPQFNFGTNPL